jgi:hypothetical protein
LENKSQVASFSVAKHGAPDVLLVVISKENDQDPGPVLGAALKNYETKLFH